MEITNAHVHMIQLDRMAQQGVTLPAGIAVLREVESSLPLLYVDTLLAQMDEAGVARSILYAVEAPIVYASNEYVAGLCAKHPDRLLGFASVNPLAEGAADALEAAVGELNLRGLKLHPPLQDFFPDDERVFPVYERAAALGIPVVFHVGTTPFGPLCRLSQANPLLIDEVAIRFPTLRILLTHLGTLWHNEAFMVAEKNPNVFIDTAAYLYEIRDILTPDLIGRVGPGKFVFGTDYPMPSPGRLHRMKDFVDCILGLGLPEEMVRGLFEENVETLLSGSPGQDQGLRAADVMAQASRAVG